MAKRAPAAEAAYNPLDVNLAQSVIQGTKASQELPPAKTAGSDTDNLPSRPYGLQTLLHVPGNDKPQPVSGGTRSLCREKRVLLTTEEERLIERLVDRIGEQLGASLKLSHLLRACIAVLCHAEQELLRRAPEVYPLPRPSNGNAVALAQFEQALARFLSKALRDAPPVR